VGNGNIAICFQNRAYFTKRGLKRRTLLHELYHHLVYVNDLDTSKTKEERDADSLAGRVARMLVPKFVCQVAYACGFAMSLDGGTPWNARSIVQRCNSIPPHLKKGI
jgi:hypothetical protein